MIAVLVLAVGTLSGMYIQVNAKTNDNRIAEGIYVESLHIGGMTKEEAEEALNTYVEELSGREFTFLAGGNTLSLTASEMGFAVLNEGIIEEALSVGKAGNLLKRYKDLADLKQGNLVYELDVCIDAETVTNLLNDNLEKLNTEVVDNGLVRENGEFVFVKGASGMEVNVEPSVAMIEEYISMDWDREDTILELDVEIIAPRGTEEELAKVKDVLGTYGTNFSSSSASRVTNVNVATDRINGTLLYPGDEFSVNETIQPRDKAHGYAMAGSYEGGQTVQSYGGGVCQVSTTLYNAVILAELEITNRQSHSMTVAYVPLSMDAAIAGDYLDFNFKNNTDSPIYIEGYTKNKNLYFTIYGEETRPENREIRFETVVLSTEDPGTLFTATADPVGSVIVTNSKHVGYRTQLWKIVTVDGKVQSREQFNSSNYRASAKTVNVGVTSADPAVQAAMTAAVASGDPHQIANILSTVAPGTEGLVLN